VLSRFFRYAGIQQPEVEGMTPEAVRSKIRHDKEKDATRLQPPFPAARQDDCPDELPPLRLSYDTWTSILPDKAIPPQAQTDLPLGKARIPRNWSLKLVTMPAIVLCFQHHEGCHIAYPKLFPSALITKHHRIL